MGFLTIRKSVLEGVVKAPPSKAYTHRLLIAASLASRPSKIENPLICRDTESTVRAVTQYGSKVTRRGNMWIVVGKGVVETPTNVVDCGESAATLRFTAPILANAPGISVLTGRKGLLKRPMGPMIHALRQLGVDAYSTRGDGCPPIVVFGGGFKGGAISLRGDVSSQFLSGLLFAAPLASGELTISMTTELESKPYVDMTMEVLKEHGVEVSVEGYREFTVSGRQEYRARDHAVEGDYSSAAFLAAAAAVTQSNVKIIGLSPNSLQGDRRVLQILSDMSVKVKWVDGCLVVEGDGRIDGVEVEARDVPDLVPVVAALACYAEGETIIKSVERLRFKESDRVASMMAEFSKTGAKLTYREGSLTIKGGRLKPATFQSHGDHRIAMACAVLGLGIEGESKISSYGCVKKSYPNFFMDLKSLGAEIAGI
ncbi:MAG: 3-phosphoshikimate 1-carboxyvinyltransferase [Candidatus Bathyarchaeia archaeon]